MKYMAPNIRRGFLGVISLILITGGAGELWGWGGAALTLGLVLFIDLSADETVERFTNTTRYKQGSVT